MKILIVLTYYRPHISGLTIYAQRLAKGLADNGHDVTILTSQHLKDLPLVESVGKITIKRLPVLFRFNKWVFMPSFIWVLMRLMNSHEIVNLHVPQVEISVASILAKLLRKKTIVTYHCDLIMPPGFINRLITRFNYINTCFALLFVDRIVAYTTDYANNSSIINKYLNKITYIFPPITIESPTTSGQIALRSKIACNPETKIIGIAARFAYEKGVGYLLHAIPLIEKEIPDFKIIFAGPYLDVIGETAWNDLQPIIQRYKEHVVFLGTLNNKEIADFFSICDLVVLASINQTESFGLVQVESFLIGTPVVATNLPGVRQPVLITGMGEVVERANSDALAEGILKVLQNRKKYIKSKSQIEKIFSFNKTISDYEKLFLELLQ